MSFLGFGKYKRPRVSRDLALAGSPVKLPTKKTETKDGKVHVTIEFNRPRWQRILGADELCERTFSLDSYGQEVFNACDGNTKVNKIMKNFAKNHRLSMAEAETAVTSFLQTLMERGMIGIEVAKNGNLV